MKNNLLSRFLKLIDPFEWIDSAQEWFSETEKSSGFRPYLVFLILVFCMAICLLIFFKDLRYVPEVTLGITVIVIISFVILYFIKSCTDPDFCRSERHLERRLKLELEKMGSETKQVEAEVLIREALTIASKAPPMLPLSQKNKNKAER
jgi:Flp pilus assembly protein TadB